MTQNQISYLRHMEDRRHNYSTERQARDELRETSRHNLVYETESMRHNKATERETNRHNIQTEVTDRNSLYEQEFHNRQTEELTLKNIKQQKYATDVSWSNAIMQQNNQLKIAQMQQNTSKYAANKSFQASVLNANTAATTQKYVASLNAATSRANAKLSSNTQIKTNQATISSNERLKTTDQLVSVLNNFVGMLPKVAPYM